MTVRAQFIEILPRHRRALEMLASIALDAKRDILGCIGFLALRDEGDQFTLEQIAEPLLVRGLIEDLSGTEMGDSGKYFVRITPLGAFCLGVGLMLRDSRKSTVAEMKKYLTPEAGDVAIPRPAFENPHDPNEEQEAIV